MSVNPITSIASVPGVPVNYPHIPGDRPYNESMSPADRFSVFFNQEEYETNLFGGGLEVMVPTTAAACAPGRRIGARVVSDANSTDYLTIEAETLGDKEFLRRGAKIAYNVEALRDQIAAAEANGQLAQVLIPIGRGAANALVLDENDLRASGTHGDFFVRSDPKLGLQLGYRDHSKNGSRRPDYEAEAKALQRKQLLGNR